MPGGRNGSAIYNIYKVKYRKLRQLEDIDSPSTASPQEEVSSKRMCDRGPRLTNRNLIQVLLSACYYATTVVTARNDDVSTTTIDEHEEVSFAYSVNIRLLQTRLSAVMGKPIPLEHVVKEAGPLVEKFTTLLQSFSKMRISTEAYVCIKAITLLHYNTSPGFLILQ